MGILSKLESLRNNFFIVVGLEEKKITWVTSKKVLSNNEACGLGVNSFFDLNRSLLFKWIWTFFIH